MRKIQVVILVMLLWSCGDPDLFNFDKLGKPEGWEPNYSLTLAKADFSLWDAFHQGDTDSATFIKDENGRLALEYRHPEIFKLGVDDIYSMQAEDMFFNGNFSINQSHFENGAGTQLRPHYDTLNVDYELVQVPKNVFIKEALVSVESMSFIVMNNANIGGMLTIVCENLYSLETGSPITVPIVLQRGQPTVNYSTQIPNLRAMLGGKSIVPLKFVLMVNDITDAIFRQNILVDITTTDVKYKNVNLTLPTAPLSIPAGAFSPDIEFLNNISGGFRFANPELRLEARTQGIGMDFELKGMEFIGRNADKTVTLNTEDKFQFIGESMNTGEASSTFVYNSTNSNIVDFAALPPRDEISYTNGMLESSGNNAMLYAGGKLSLDLVLRIPLELSATDLVFYDTISDLNLKDADKILEAKLRFEGNNGLKMDLQIPELYLLDESNQIIDKVANATSEIFRAATDEGPTYGSIEIALERNHLINLSKAKHIVLKLLVNSPQHTTVVIDEQARLDLKLRINAKVNMGDIVYDD